MSTTTPDTSRALIELSCTDPELTRARYAAFLDTSPMTITGLSDEVFALDNGALMITGGVSGDARLILGGADDPDVTDLLRRRGLPFAAGVDGILTTSAHPAIGLVDLVPVAPACDTVRDITRFDHIVVGATDRDSAVALFGAVLGFDFRLEQRAPRQTGAAELRQLFFRTGRLVVEVLVGQPNQDQTIDIGVWGLAWHSTDIDATRARLIASGFETSGIRNGAKQGTRVCTVRDPGLSVPTIVIGR